MYNYEGKPVHRTLSFSLVLSLSLTADYMGDTSPTPGILKKNRLFFLEPSASCFASAPRRIEYHVTTRAMFYEVSIHLSDTDGIYDSS